MLVLRLFGYHVGSPTVRDWIIVAMKDLGGVVAEQAIDLVLAVAPVGIEEVRQVLRETDCSESFLSCRGLKQRILFNREMVRFVFPQEDWTVEWRSESAAVYRALEKLSPNDGSVLADFAIPLHRQVNDDDLALKPEN